MRGTKVLDWYILINEIIQIMPVWYTIDGDDEIDSLIVLKFNIFRHVVNEMSKFSSIYNGRRGFDACSRAILPEAGQKRSLYLSILWRSAVPNL